MANFLKTERTIPLFYYLKVVVEKLTVLNLNERLRKISVNAGASFCILCADQQVLNIWDQRTKEFDIGKNIIIDGKIDLLEVIAETSTGRNLKARVLLSSLDSGKPARRIFKLCGQNDVVELELQCILFKRPLHYQIDTINSDDNQPKSKTGLNSSVGMQTEAPRVRDVGVNPVPVDHWEKATQTSGNYFSSPDQRKILLRMAALLVNGVQVRLLEYQRKKLQNGHVSRQVNTDFTLPTTLTQNELNQSIQLEHLQDIKKRLQELSRQRGLLEERSKQITPFKRACCGGEEKSNMSSTVKTFKPISKLERSIAAKKVHEQDASRASNLSRTRNDPEIPRVESGRSSSKSWISSRRSNDPKSLKQPTSTGHTPKSPLNSTEISSSTQSEGGSSSETTKERDQSEESDSSSSSKNDSDTEEEEGSSSDSRGSIKDIEKSTDSSIPTEIDSNASQRSYLESVAISSDSDQKRPAPRDLSPTSAYLQKLRNDVLRGRT